MQTTKPFLYIAVNNDLQKSWREDIHPRDTFGKFSTVKGGSRVVTKTGKTGVVEEAGSTHHTVRYDDGKKAKVAKDNVLHANDHKKVTEAKAAAAKKAKANKAKASKTAATKTHNKTNATGKTGASKTVADPTVKPAAKKPAAKAPAKAKPDAVSKQLNKNAKTATKTTKKKASEDVKAYNKKASAEKKAIRQSKKERDMAAPVLKRQTTHDESSKTQEVKQKVGRGKNTNKTPSDVAQTDAQQELAQNKVPNTKLDRMWEAEAGKIMSKPPEKRSDAAIRDLAGRMVDENKTMANYMVQKMAAARGINLANNHIQYHQGAKRTKEDKAMVAAKRSESYATGTHGDMLQMARESMFDTLTSVLSGSQNPKAGTSIAQHVFRRMKQDLHRDMYKEQNVLAAPHAMRQAIGDAHKAEMDLSQKLGRTPSEDEVAQHLQKTSESFRSAAINKPAKWDENENDWVATKERYTDPVERLRALKTYAAQQKVGSLDKNIGSDGEKAVTAGDSIHERTGASIEQQYEEKERQAELSDKLPKAMEAIGMKPEHILAYRVKFSQGSETGTKASLTSKETAQKINEMGGFNGEPVTEKWVDNRLAAGGKVITRAIQEQHPAMMALREMLTKSFVWGLILKSLYEYDLVKSLASWGVDHTILEQVYTRTVVAPDRLELRKSLEPHEYIGSYVVTDEGEYVARIVEYALPERNELYKSFNMFATGLRKSFFPHKGGGNAAINNKASDYVRNNSGKYKALSNSQHSAAKKKGGNHTWSEELLLKNPGSCWITWGGKRILVHGESGEVLYDSANEAHREEHNQGAQQDKIDFHHEKEAVSGFEKKREEALRHEWSGGDKKKQDAFAKKNRGVSFDNDGNLNFQADEGVNEHNQHHFDDGINAFKGELDRLGENWGTTKGEMQKRHAHKLVGMYSEFSDEDKKDFDGLDEAGRDKFVGNHMLKTEGVREVMQKAAQMASEGKKGEDIQAELKPELDALGEKANSMALLSKRRMTRVFNDMAKQKGGVTDDYLAGKLGEHEIARGGEESNKRILDEGTYMVGNPITGKVMAVKFGHKLGGKSNRYTSYIAEAFDPETGDHFKGSEDADTSWGQLGKALGILGGASQLQEDIVQKSNTEVTKPMVKQMTDEEWNQARSKTKAGLQDSMLHKDFKKVKQTRDKAGNVKDDTYAMTMPDGTTNHVSVDGRGMIKDPLMQRLLNQREPIQDEKDLNDLMKRAAGNKTWVTAHFGRDIHVGDALGHHVQLEYDGKGAPVVRGGKYDGYRYMDAKDAKGAIDPATGEPVKALFKNGKLVDRRFTKVNNVDMKQGNPVMYPTGDGKFRKGKFHSEVEGGVKVTDGKGHVVGVFKKNELKHATSEGRTLSDSGNAVVKLGQTGAHRMDTEGAFKSDNPKEQRQLNKLKGLFQNALRKADINQGAFDSEGNLGKNMELSDQQHARLKKVLGRSKAGKALLAQIQSAYTPSLEVHVPEALRQMVASEGVTLHNNGIAKVSAAKFEQLRDVLNKNGSGISLDNAAQSYMQDHFARKDRKPKTMDELKRKYQSFEVPDKGAGSFGSLYRGMFKPSYVSEPFITKKDKETGKPLKDKDGNPVYDLDEDGNKKPGGLYSTQLEGLSHLIERKNAIAGHGMGTGKTILGVMAHAHYKATKLANNQKPKKTLIVSPAGIMSDWGKEIGSHTNMKALYVGSASKMHKKDKDGKKMTRNVGTEDKPEHRNLWGGDGLEHEAVSSKDFIKNLQKHASEDHDFHVMSYDQFMKHRDALTASGMYDNIAIDEIHAFKNKTGQRGTALSESTAKFDNVWGLSGTPMENDAREVHSLVDTVTGGKHELGSEKEFRDTYMQKDKNGKIVGVKDKWAANTPSEVRGTYQSPSEKLGDILANVVQFRGGEDVKYNNGTKITFPNLVGHTDENNPNPQHDFIADMVDRNRDHKTTDYYGTKHSVTDFKAGTKTVTSKSGDTYEVQTFQPVSKDPATKAMYDKYNELQAQILPESKLNELATAAATGYDQGQKGKSNYLTAMQKLQKFTNAPLTHKMYVPGAASALDAEDEGTVKKGKKKSEPIPFETDSDGHKRYYESDGKGSYAKNADGSPKLLPPLHKQNPKAQYLQDRVHTYLDSLQKENRRRVASGDTPLMPKLVVKSSYTTFGTDIVDSVLRDVQKTHPIFGELKKMGFGDVGAGQFTGKADDREQTKGGFRGDKNNYAKNQGNLWATTVSPAGKEGVDFGNAHLMLMYDQEWNPQRMAQFTARVRRSDSVKTHQQVGRSNSVRVESLHMPGTVEDFLFNAEDAKMADIQQVTKNTRTAEEHPKLGETQGSIGYGHRGFTTKKNLKQVPKGAQGTGKAPKAPKTQAPTPKVAASVAKSIQFVILR